MKKLLILFPLTTIALTSCSNDVPRSDPPITNAIPMRMDTELQSVAMPSSMTQPSYQIPTYSTSTPAYSVPATPSYSSPTPNYSAPQPVYTQPQTVSTTRVQQQSNVVGSCQVVRDANSAPVYAQIQKGCYTEAQYTVAKGDTIFLIAYLSGKSVDEIAMLNQLTQPYQLKVGQVLRVK